jgi:hypothetical protein
MKSSAGEPTVFVATVELESDGLQGTLNKPAEIREGSDRALYKEDRKRTLECRVTHLQRSTYRGAPAVLVCFEFNFITFSPSKRMTEAHIDGVFSYKSCQETDVELMPAQVVKYAPERVEGPKIEVATEREKGMKLEMGLRSPPVPVEAAVEVGVTERMTFSSPQGLEVRATALGTRENSEKHRVHWKMEEDGARKKGIPSSFRAAVMVQVQEGATLWCNLEVRVKTGWRSMLLRKPWSSDKPLVMHHDAWVGTPLPVEWFELMEDRDWRRLLAIDYDVAVSVIVPLSSLAGPLLIFADLASTNSTGNCPSHYVMVREPREEEYEMGRV